MSGVAILRAAGYVIDCRKGTDGRDRYFVAESRPVTVGEQVGMALV